MQEHKIRVALAEDHEVLREKYSALISFEADIELVGVAKSGQEIISIAENLQPNVILMDVEMDTNDAGIRATEYISQNLPGVRIIMLTVHDDRENIIRALIAGACSYVLKTGSALEIIQAIRKAYYNSPYLSSDVIKTMIAEVRGIDRQRESLLYTMNILSNLTKTELSILLLLYQGKTPKEICELRCIEMSTIKTHTQNILRKFGRSRIKSVISDIEHQNLFPYLSSFVSE